MDIVPCLVANGPHPALKDYLKRPRGEWPSQEQLREVQQMPLFLVLVDSKITNHPNQETRISWSAGEMLLISKLPTFVKRGLIAAKCTFKHFVKIYRAEKITDDGRSHVGSYHIKTTLLNHLEKTPPSKMNSAFHVMMNVFKDLCIYIKRGKLPHHFLPECNLLARVGHDERQIALQAIQNIVSDPITAVLNCPSESVNIYGDICPDDLVAAFRQLYDHPSSQGSYEGLVQLLSWLDLWRRCRYIEQLDTDKRFSISSRPGLTGLVDILKAIKKDNRWNICIYIHHMYITHNC